MSDLVILLINNVIYDSFKHEKYQSIAHIRKIGEKSILSRKIFPLNQQKKKNFLTKGGSNYRFISKTYMHCQYKQYMSLSIQSVSTIFKP